MIVDAECPRRELVQQRLPHVGARSVDERDVRAALPAEPVAQARDKLEPSGAAADDHDAVRALSGQGRGAGLHAALPTDRARRHLPLKDDLWLRTHYAATRCWTQRR